MPQDDAFDLVIECEAANIHFKIVKNDLLQVITDRVKIDDIGDFIPEKTCVRWHRPKPSNSSNSASLIFMSTPSGFDTS